MTARSVVTTLTLALLVLISFTSANAQAGCDPNESCTRRGPNYPCPTWRNPGKMCASYFDDPICLTRRTACQGELSACITSGLVTYGAGAACVGCVYVGALTTGGTAAAACVGVCGVGAEALQQVMNRCGR